jgi:hypothetical protein
MTLRVHLDYLADLCTKMETISPPMKREYFVAADEEQLHQLVCRLETIATSLRNLT